MITTGAQQALSTAAACWVRPGDAVLVEDPTYPGALSAFGAAGARLVGLPVDRHGVRPDALRAALAEHPVLAYLQPTLHSPTGAVLAAGRRARDRRRCSPRPAVPLVEDHALAGPRLGRRARRRSPSTAPTTRARWSGSLSKRFWGGLRVGFVRAAEPVALRFARVKATHDLGSSAISQVLAQRLLEHPDADRFVAAPQRRAARPLRASSPTRCAAQLPDWTWTEPSGGLSVWVRLPRPVAEPFAQAALRDGVAVATVRGAVAVGRPPRPHPPVVQRAGRRARRGRRPPRRLAHLARRRSSTLDGRLDYARRHDGHAPRHRRPRPPLPRPEHAGPT